MISAIYYLIKLFIKLPLLLGVGLIILGFIFGDIKIREQKYANNWDNAVKNGKLKSIEGAWKNHFGGAPLIPFSVSYFIYFKIISEKSIDIEMIEVSKNDFKSFINGQTLEVFVLENNQAIKGFSNFHRTFSYMYFVFSFLSYFIGILLIFRTTSVFFELRKLRKSPLDIKSDKEHDRIFKIASKIAWPYINLAGMQNITATSISAKDDMNFSISLLKAVVSYNKKNWQAHWVMGKVYQNLKENFAACQAFKQAYDNEQNNPDVAREYMLSCLKLGLIEKGLNAGIHALSLDSKDASLHSNLAIAYLLAGQNEASLNAIDTSLKLNQIDPISHYVKKIIDHFVDNKLPPPKNLQEFENYQNLETNNLNQGKNLWHKITETPIIIEYKNPWLSFFILGTIITITCLIVATQASGSALIPIAGIGCIGVFTIATSYRSHRIGKLTAEINSRHISIGNQAERILIPWHVLDLTAENVSINNDYMVIPLLSDRLVEIQHANATGILSWDLSEYKKHNFRIKYNATFHRIEIWSKPNGFYVEILETLYPMMAYLAKNPQTTFDLISSNVTAQQNDMEKK